MNSSARPPSYRNLALVNRIQEPHRPHGLRCEFWSTLLSTAHSHRGIRCQTRTKGPSPRISSSSVHRWGLFLRSFRHRAGCLLQLATRHPPPRDSSSPAETKRDHLSYSSSQNHGKLHKRHITFRHCSQPASDITLSIDRGVNLSTPPRGYTPR